jgi:hypothetical protein
VDKSSSASNTKIQTAPFCELRPADEIEAKVQEGTLVPHGDCSIALLRRIIASADASKRISREMKKFLRSVDLPPLP